MKAKLLQHHWFRLVLILPLVLLLLLLSGPLAGEAAVRIRRPLIFFGGQINQGYLWGEETVQSGQTYTHRGIDFGYPAILGTNIYAVADGVVRDKVENLPDNEHNSTWGNFVLIEHTDRHFDRTTNTMGYVYSMYLHLSANSVPPGVEIGSSVTEGQWIGKVDNTGSGSFGSHLHLQIVVHPQSGRTLIPFTLDSENRSRNPEFWLTPYTDATARVAGRVTDANGNSLPNLVICGLQKSYGGYWWSRTYSFPWANPDDYMVENFATTDVQPGTYHIYAYPFQGSTQNTCVNPPAPVADLGEHQFTAGQTTYIGLHPVFLPDIRSGVTSGNSKIVIRNNGTKKAEVNTTFFLGGYNYVIQSRTDLVGPRKVIEIDPTGSFSSASALVVGSQDISVMVRQELPGSVYASYLGVSKPTTEVYIPLLHRNNSNWYSQLNIQNSGYAKTTVTVDFKPWNGFGEYCTLSYEIDPLITRRIDLYSTGDGCITNAQEPVFVGSAFIKSDNDQPLAVTYPQQLISGSAIQALMESSKTGAVGGKTYAPLIQNYNSYYKIVSGVASQNANTDSNTIRRRFRSGSGSTCTIWNTTVQGLHSVIDILPPGQSGACPPVLSALFRNLGNAGVSATVNQFWSGNSPYPNYWTDYPAISNPTENVVVPFWYDQGGWDTAMVIQNTTGSTASGKVTFYNSNGVLSGAPVPITVPPNGFVIVDAPIGNLYGSALVSASRNVAVMVNYFNPTPGGDKIMSNAGDHKP
jgi:Peptidase family M23